MNQHAIKIQNIEAMITHDINLRAARKLAVEGCSHDRVRATNALIALGYDSEVVRYVMTVPAA